MRLFDSTIITDDHPEPLQNGFCNTGITLDDSSNFTRNWKSLQNPLLDLERMLCWVICSPCWPCKNTRSFCRKLRITLSYPKCRPNNFSFDHFVDPGARGPVCTYKEGGISTPREFKRGSLYLLRLPVPRAMNPVVCWEWSFFSRICFETCHVSCLDTRRNHMLWLGFWSRFYVTDVC